jgi:hypothetical protein
MNMCETTYYLLWNTSAIAKWVQGLGFLLNPWVKKYTPILHISPQLVDTLEVWRPIYSSMQSELVSSEFNIIIEDNYQYEPRNTIIRALQQLSEASTYEIAIELDRWVRRHFFCEYLQKSLRVWERLFSIAYRFENETESIVKPPEELINILYGLNESPYALNIFDDEKDYWRNINRDIKGWLAANPNVTFDSVQENSEILTLGTIIEECSTIWCFQQISLQLTFWEMQNVVRWALMQASVWRGHDRLFIRGDELIKLELPCHNTPSVLEMYTNFPP